VQDAEGDWLVNQVQAFIDIAFRMTTGNVEALRPSGLLLLKVPLHLLWAGATLMCRGNPTPHPPPPSPSSP